MDEGVYEYTDEFSVHFIKISFAEPFHEAIPLTITYNFVEVTFNFYWCQLNSILQKQNFTEVLCINFVILHSPMHTQYDVVGMLMTVVFMSIKDMTYNIWNYS